jgi:hypothetical protein
VFLLCGGPAFGQIDPNILLGGRAPQIDSMNSAAPSQLETPQTADLSKRAATARWAGKKKAGK